MSYLLGALQRYECQKNAQDLKKNCFTCTLDGDSAFEVVNRPIQKREIFAEGEEGALWQFTNASYDNTKCQMKLEGKLSRKTQEELGVRQGHIKSSDHYKTYVSPALASIDSSNLGYWIGPICVSVSGVADDVCLLSDAPDRLQQLLHLASHYGNRYRVRFVTPKLKLP